MRVVSGNGNKNSEPAAVKNAGARRRYRLWLAFIVIFIGWAGYTFISQASQIGAGSRELSEKQDSKAKSNQALNQLKTEIERLKDPEYIGQIAMKKYGLYRPGEVPIRVPASEDEK
ncbi:septum formation initiator family protein [Paenibacillus sp. YPG26]|uniref:FtsB family cell division protein n=1 Tax=Paenibacillus sp. YPG26 TaxID=2878915 RepID=UPI00203BF2BB|nr:septum formation initiator family protein [Paenibacillus sp. YPG26]USB33316.1 septum formation initiator family protein [Paenibacillus sp. YPG26]